MYFKTIIAVVAAAIVTLQAQTVNITGKVTNKSGKGITGAVVSLASRKLSATTDASGAYSLKTAVAAEPVAIQPHIQALSLNKGVVTMNLLQPAPVQIELFDIKGSLLEKALDRTISAGTYRFDLMKQRFAVNMMLVRVSVGQQTSNFRYFPLTNGKSAISSTTALATVQPLGKMPAIQDTLQTSASRYTAKKTEISSYEGTVDIILDTSNCTATPSKASTTTVTGSGPHKVVIETNSDPGIKEGTIYRPTDLGLGKNYPVFVWGEGACSQDGLSNKASMGEIASWGYFVVADGSSSGGGGTAAALVAYIAWAIAQNGNPCSAYYQSLDTTKIAADGFSCGGLMAENAAGDPRFAAAGFTSSGLFSADQAVYKKIHTPFKILLGGTADMAYANGVRDYDSLSARGIPILFLSKNGAGHGGDLGNGKGDFNTVNLAWLNWQLKGDTGATGKALLVGPTCKYCNASGWEFKSKNLP
jgi:hypothetical protein